MDFVLEKKAMMIFEGVCFCVCCCTGHYDEQSRPVLGPFCDTIGHASTDPILKVNTTFIKCKHCPPIFFRN